MREKEFRIYDIETQQFFYWGIADNPPTCLIKYYIKKNTNDFIGFKDKNNKKIYEKDICKFSDFSPKIIEWKDGRFWLGNTLVICCEMECSEMEIIGNIYENPELLKELEKK